MVAGLRDEIVSNDPFIPCLKNGYHAFVIIHFVSVLTFSRAEWMSALKYVQFK